MGTLTILIRSGSMMNMDANVAVELANAALDKGHDVKIFCYGEGVTLAKEGQDPRSFPNIEEEMAKLISRGAEVVICSTCSTARGMKMGEEMEGATVGSLTNDLSRFISESDRLVTLAR